jgi:hypothetical protein
LNNLSIAQKLQSAVNTPIRKSFQEVQEENRKKVCQWMREEMEEEEAEYKQEDERVSFRN